MFSRDKLVSDVADQSWDKVKVVCTQPFNKRIKYGIAFINLKSPESEAEKKKRKEETNTTMLGAFRLKEKDESSSVESLFSKRQKETPKDTTTKMSVAAEARSLASVALKESGTSPKKRLNPEGERNSSEAKRQRTLTGERENKKLPRRDTIPGESPIKKREPEKKDSRNGNSARKATPKTTNKTEPSRPKFATRPFSKLFEGVVFALSGFQNPLRGEIRQKALDMGARYRPDWDSSCTHLICAFANTPKFNQVKKAGGKIAKKGWIEESHSTRKRKSWRKHCLDPKDSTSGDGNESEEVWDETLVPNTSSSTRTTTTPQKGKAKPPDDEIDTDDEIEEVRKQQKRAEMEEEEEGYDQDTDDEIEAVKEMKKDDDDSDEAYNADTDVDEEEEGSSDGSDLPELPDFFVGVTFMLKGDFSDGESRSLRRQILAAGGKCVDYMGPTGVDYVITNSRWNEDFGKALKDFGKVRFVKPGYVSGCWKEKRRLPWKEYAVKRK